MKYEMKIAPYDEAKYLDNEKVRQGYLDSCRTPLSCS